MTTMLLVFVLPVGLGEFFGSPLYFISFALCACSFLVFCRLWRLDFLAGKHEELLKNERIIDYTKKL